MQDSVDNNLIFTSNDVENKSQVEKIKNLENHINNMLSDTTYYNNYISSSKSIRSSSNRNRNKGGKYSSNLSNVYY